MGGVAAPSTANTERHKMQAGTDNMSEREVQLDDPSFYRPSSEDPVELRTAIQNFSTNNEEFAKSIRITRDKLKQYIETARNKKTIRPYNILLVAPPGMGKSFIAKEIARDVGGDDAEIDEVYIASMIGVQEIDDVFRRVQSIYLDGKIPAVIFDEVDSQINGFHVYNRFLSPMWDGKFFVSGVKHTLPPSIFFFAGSAIAPKKTIDCAVKKAREKHGPDGDVPYSTFLEEWVEIYYDQFSANESKPPEKLEDFISRIDDTILIPPIMNLQSPATAKKEFRAMACVLIRKHHGSKVNKIQENVLQALAQTIEIDGLRAAEKVIFISKPADQLVFTGDLLPEDFRHKNELGKGTLTQDHAYTRIDVKSWR